MSSQTVCLPCSSGLRPRKSLEYYTKEYNLGYKAMHQISSLARYGWTSTHSISTQTIYNSRQHWCSYSPAPIFPLVWHSCQTHRLDLMSWSVSFWLAIAPFESWTTQTQTSYSTSNCRQTWMLGQTWTGQILRHSSSGPERTLHSFRNFRSQDRS